jgi:DNA-binding transcriptional LysR family regulator
MDLRHMRHFIAVAEELHFGRAAQRLNIAQPPLSQSIQRLELNLGVQLLNRSRRGVEMTEAGRVFLEEARRTLRHAELARKMTQRAAEQIPEVRVSFVGPALYQVLPELLKRFRMVAPDVEVRLFEQPSPDQVIGVEAGDTDVGFCTGATAISDECETLVVERAPFVAAVPADWPLARQDSITLMELAEQPWIQSPPKYSAAAYESMSMFKSAGVIPKVVQEATQTNTTLSLVGAGLGCAMVTATAALAQPRNVRILPITGGDVPIAQWELVMIWHPKQIGIRAREFVETGCKYVEDLEMRPPLAPGMG